MNRRAFLAFCSGLPLAAFALPGRFEAEAPMLDPEQSRAVRAWIAFLADEQIRRPSPRWTHRDCASLVRFCVAEALACHDEAWRQSMGLANHRLPPDLVPEVTAQTLRHRWWRPDGSTGAYVSALGLVQENSRFVGKSLNQLETADLLFFDQGQSQHLMLWTGRRIVYHTGSAPTPTDDGLRAISPAQLLAWPDNRWRPVADNPNFAGIFALGFLSS
ncbi:MAG: DUF1175 family protein [Zoogloeaceae bacterium]|jgi:uncharacterized protein YfaT (DUF1175 family)|nr:DUF1175 family protein [Zoogloeaceae bacterium]